MGILDQLVSVSEKLVRQARLRVVDQQRIVAILELQRDTEAVARAEMVLVTLERAYRVALYRLKADRAVSGQ
jgi:hypothetical protein